MNWTEGNLARHSRGRQRDELLTRQKQHFAKARNNLSNAHVKQTPVAISFLGPEYARNLDRRGDSTRSRHTRSPSPVALPKSKWTTESQSRSNASSSANREKRRRLLDKSDWAGLSLQQPIDIAFPGQLHAAGGSRWSKISHQQERRGGRLRELLEARRAETSEHFHKPPMRIQIGSQEIQPSTVTGSQTSRRQYSLAPRPLTKSIWRISPRLSSPFSSQAQHPAEATDSGPRPHASQNNERSHESGSLQSDFTALHVTTTKPETPAHVIHSSSMIHEPVPRRADDFVVLQWSPSRSDDRSSMQVEVEQPARPVPPSREAQHQLWRDWIMDSPDTAPNNQSHSPLATDSSSVIPTVSSISKLPSHLQRKLPSLEISSEADRSPERSSLKQYGSPVLPEYPGQRLPEPRREETNFSIEVQPAEDIQRAVDAQLASEANAANDVEPAEEVKPPEDAQRTERAKPTEDPNSLWMRLALGDDTDEVLEDCFKEAAHQAALELRPSETTGTSDSLGDATETAATCGTEHSTCDEQQQDESVPSDFLSQSHAATKATSISDSMSSNIAVAGSSDEPMRSAPLFVLPKTFVGKLAESGARVRVHSPPVAKGPKGRGKGKGRRKSKNKALDGRTDIRSLPDFDGDPIEEFED
ncbi:Uu.00g097210.m01.CDS01 [Anthostomella pinea]|uniref:Uu.00g097210.m01.CDS01 n=1 Tax=Anthostomella pinea TaxID=933095 RepID=A0AAI8VCX0_9PEZI|nr:Uu.00g097210.m01.CDS01 [Anthostomella pinea]